MRFSEAFLKKSQELPSVKSLQSLTPNIVAAAQNVYNNWIQDENDPLNGGGICQDIASAICAVLNSAGIDCAEISAQVGEQHVWTVAKFNEGVYEIDIAPGYYETGGGYNWTKIPDVEFDSSMLHIGRLSPDPEDFESYIEYN
jgi:hypothetical protein